MTEREREIFGFWLLCIPMTRNWDDAENGHNGHWTDLPWTVEGDDDQTGQQDAPGSAIHNTQSVPSIGTYTK